MTFRIAAATLAMVVGLAAVSLLAHEVTYKGTVISAEKGTVRVTVIDEKTKKPGPMTFDVDKDSKVLRGDKVITWEQARVQKGEKIAVTVNHDADEKYALVVRLDEKK